MWKIEYVEQTVQDSHLSFYCLYCNLLTDHVIVIQKGKDKTAQHKGKKQNQKCEHRIISLLKTVHAVPQELECSLPTPPDVPVCWATNSQAASLLFLFFFSLAVDPVQFLVLPLSDNVTLCCAPAIYIYLLASSWFMRCTFELFQ